jgi:hypothetical protein
MTVADAQAILIARTRDLLVLLGLDPAADPANPDLAAVLGEALAAACRAAGVFPASPLAPADAELALVPYGGDAAFLDVAWLRLLRTLRDRARSRSDQTAGMDQYKFSQVADGLQQTIDREEVRIDGAYLAGAAGVVVGPIDRNYRTPGSYPLGTFDPYADHPPWP